MGDKMDVIAGLALMFGSSDNAGNDSSSGTVEVKKLAVGEIPTAIYYYDTVEETAAVSIYNEAHVIREVYENDDIDDKYYQLLISDVDTDAEKVIGIKDLSTGKVVYIADEVM